MKLKVVIFSFFILFSGLFFSQELFPLNEPASNVPKGVLGVRVFGNAFQEVKTIRNLSSLRLMYGVLPKLTVMATVSVSNHHDKNFAPNLVSHTHNGNQTTYATGNFQRGLNYPFSFSGVYLFAKYRFLSVDGQNSHFRMAAYAEGSTANVAHDEAEPNLLDDTKGFGGGLIVTYLKKHLAVSLTSGAIIPGKYNGFSPDVNGGPMIPTQIKYGRAIKYNLSFGYLLIPKTYKNYDDPNFNIYVEFMGKSYEGAKVTQYGFIDVPISTPLLQKGNYVDIAPGIQYIIKSNLRIDFSAEFPLISKGYTQFYPVFVLGVQRYFYFKKKSAQK